MLASLLPVSLGGVDAAARVDHQGVFCPHDRRAEQPDEADGHHGGERPLDRDRFDRRSIDSSTPSSMITNRNSTTIAPA